MALETITSATGEIVSLDQAKKQLGIWDDDQDDIVLALLASARDFCERWSERTLRLAVERTYATRNWPRGGWVLRHPPVTAVDSIAYYDGDNVLQTLDAANYHVNITAEGFAHVEYASGATLPSVYDRPASVVVTYSTGYATADDAPETAKAAILLVLKAIDGEDKPAIANATMDRAKNLLSTVSVPTYA